jgi:hypothetical protein
LAILLEVWHATAPRSFFLILRCCIHNAGSPIRYETPTIVAEVGNESSGGEKESLLLQVAGGKKAKRTLVWFMQ